MVISLSVGVRCSYDSLILAVSSATSDIGGQDSAPSETLAAQLDGS